MGEEEKKEILGQKLDEKELDDIAGGCREYERYTCPDKGCVGGCKDLFYIESCKATVERGSNCVYTDYHGLDYHPTDAVTYTYRTWEDELG